MADLSSLRRTESSDALRVFSGLVHAVHAQRGNGSANVGVNTLSGENGRPESFRDVGESRDVPPCVVTLPCTSRAKTQPLSAAKAQLLEGEREATFRVVVLMLNRPGVARALAARSLTAEAAWPRAAEISGHPLTHRLGDEDEAVAPRPRISGHSAREESRRSGPARSAPLHAVHLQMLMFELLSTGSGERGSGSIPEVGTTSSRHWATKVAQADSELWRATVLLRRVVASTSTATTKQELLRGRAVVARRPHKPQVVGSTPALATDGPSRFLAQAGGPSRAAFQRV
jgi:hypothetical protein